MKICKRCNKSKPASTEYFESVSRNRDGLHGTCRECRSEMSKISRSKRREQGRHLIHDKNCDYCGDFYKTENLNQRFCSTECQYDWQRNSKEFDDKIYVSINRDKLEQDFINDLTTKYPTWEYHSGFTSREGYFYFTCLDCGELNRLHCQVVKDSWTKNTECPTCRKEERKRRKAERLKQVQILQCNQERFNSNIGRPLKS